MSGARLAVVGGIMGLVAIALTARASTLPSAPESHLADLPFEMDQWQGRSDPPLADDVVAVLRADEYLLRTYGAAVHSPVGLYIAYYNSPQSGATIHSPLNCLPGSGWDPVERGRLTMALPTGSPATINRYIVQKGTDRQAVYYWFQSRGRIVASEYTSRMLLVRDSLFTGRSDGAIVRLSVPLGSRYADADRTALAFVGALYPVLIQHLPA